ncbi:SOS response-associated peptidase [Gluconacetobacter entanii]|uniref:Abasic site processing protein n=1 Tax=Gluconacetobacter entanii TaxID=108528 RepID=A0ABT3KB18_9PROT|nr:SOS response-associated peptidase [Gluconacetobacter entanii]MCW4592281.1 SOS response-associated peptidase [Gluconacetobacter entanii]MCW4595710.1 SOS response-associated peptidase [Gluconacetobacter entanii]NPC87494.1 SOS response-associated peptidase [Gluconacetobacter entanii]
MCNLYAMTSSQQAIRKAARVMTDHTGNLPPLPDIWPNTMAPIVRNAPAGGELVMARWGMPTPPGYLKGHRVDRGVTNIRNPTSTWWKRWDGVAHRCLVPLTAFSEPARLPDGKSHPVWFTRSAGEPLAFFAGIWCRWTSVRKLADGETTDDLFGFLTTTANREVGAIHPKAMPVILTRAEELDIWMNAPPGEALRLQRPLPDGTLTVMDDLHGAEDA